MAKALEKRRRIPLFPIHLLLDHPQAIALPCAGFGMLARLVAHFWITECKPLPKSNTERASIMRAHRHSLAIHEKEIFQIFEEIRPELESRFKAYQNKRENVLRLAAKGHATLALKARLKQAQAAPPIPQVPKRAHIERKPEPLPQASPAWRE